MKRLITSFALTMLVMLAASGIASAQTNYTCANVPASISGYAVIGTATTACSITKAITANASIEILGTTISTEAVTDTDGNILMISQGSLTASGTITGAADFNIDLKANQGGGNANLTIGSGGISKIVAMAGTSIVYVTNGTASSTGTITLSADSDISVPDGSNDYIILNAQAGTISIPTGTLSATGSSGPGGQIQLLAATVNFANNAILTTAQTSSSYSDHGVAISAATINYGGTSTGLEIIGDGGGGFTYLLPQSATTIADSGNYQDLTIVVTNTQTLQNPLSVVGAYGAPFKMTANNSTVGIHVVAYPISFTGGAVALQANAPGGDYIEVFNPGTLSGKTGLTFGGTGTVLIDASGNGGAGGYLYISADQTVVSAPTLTLNASGPSSGSGNGGTLYFQTTKTTLSGATVSILNNGSATGTGNAGSYTQFYSSGAVQMPTTTFTMSANGSSGGAGNGGPVYFQGSSTTVPAGLKSTITANGGGSGTGSGGTITMYPVSNITLGNNAGQFAVSATSGSTGGNGGSISIEPFSSTLTVNNTATPISVAVLGATGNGGSITLQASTITFNGTSSQLTANGGSTSGNGGSITLNASTTALTIGTGSSGNVQLYAKAPGNGNGGSISVTDYTGITVNSADLSVLAGTTGNGNGGSIAFTGGPATLTGSFSANGSGNGNGGTLNFQNGYFTFNGTQSFTANSSGTGQGGTITFNSTYNESSTLTLGANTTLQANSTSGNAGTITITSAYQPVDIDGGTGDSITVNAGGNGNGGTFSVTATQITLSGEIEANGQGSGSGGTITLDVTGTTPLDLTEGQQIMAVGGDTGDGGQVILPNVAEFAFGEVVDVDADDGDFAANINPRRAHVTVPGDGIHPDVTFQAQGGIFHYNNTVVECQQYKVIGGVNSQPAFFYDCADPLNLSPLDSAPATWIANSALLGTNSTAFNKIFPTYTTPQGAIGSTTNLYIVQNIGEWATMRGLGANYFTAGAGANTRYHPDANNPNINWFDIGIAEEYTPPYDKGNPLAISTLQITANTAHELGHVLDGPNHTYSAAGTFTGTYLNDDQNNLIADTGSGAQDKGALNQVPCTITPTDKAAFDGQTGAAGSVMNDIAGAAICNEATGQLAPPSTGNTNLLVAQNAATGIYGATNPNSEIFAESFGWAVYGSTLSNPQYGNYFQMTFDGMLTNGYYGCALAWANYALTGVNTVPAYCH